MNLTFILHWIIVFGVFAVIVLLLKAPVKSSRSQSVMSPIDNSEWLKKTMQWLSIFFVTSLTSTILILVIAYEAGKTSSGSSSMIFGISLLVMLFSGLGFYISLGILAKRLGKSWITWVGLTILSSPFGAFVAYFRMRNCVIEESKSKQA